MADLPPLSTRFIYELKSDGTEFVLYSDEGPGATKELAKMRMTPGAAYELLGLLSEVIVRAMSLGTLPGQGIQTSGHIAIGFSAKANTRAELDNPNGCTIEIQTAGAKLLRIAMPPQVFQQAKQALNNLAIPAASSQTKQ